MLDQIQPHRRGRALISDDDEFFRVAICSVLRERNAFSEVIETSSFDDALERLSTVGKIEIGLFDLNMDGMENWLDLSTLRSEFPDMRLVVVSASRKRADILRALEIGAHGFIHKGLGVGELRRAVDLICDGQVYVPPFLPENAGSPINDDMAEALSVDETPRSTHTALPNEIAALPSSVTRPLQCSPRQREVLDLLIKGLSNKGMARALNLSEGTIKFHMAAIMRLLGVNSRVAAATCAIKQFSDDPHMVQSAELGLKRAGRQSGLAL